jgi:thiol peroxidase
MAVTKFGETEIHTCGDLPNVGEHAPDFTLTAADLSDLRLADLLGKKIVLNIFPSIDTSTCQSSVREFNKRASGAENVVVVCVAMDLPFAMSRFCGQEGLENVQVASGFRSSFGRAFGVELIDGLLRSLYARAVIVIDEQGIVAHQQLVDQLGDEPNYDAVFSVL